MNFEYSDKDGTIVFSLFEKRLDTSFSGLLKSEITQIFGKSSSEKFILHLPEIEICDSSGLSALLVANRLVQQKKGQLRVVTQSDKILTLIKITRLDQVLTVSKTIDEAIQDMGDEQ